VLNVRGVGSLRLTCWSKRVCSHHIINHLSECWGRRIVYQLKQGLQTDRKGFSIPKSERASPSGVTRWRDELGILITRLVMFCCDWPSRSKLSSFKLHWSIVHSLSLLFTAPCRRLTLDFRLWSLENFHWIIFGEFHPGYKPVWGAVGHHVSDIL